MKPKLQNILAETIKASLSKPVKKAESNNSIYKVKLKLITKEPHLFFIEEYTKTQSFHKTLHFDECLSYLKKNIGKNFRAALFESSEKNYQFLSNKHGFTRILEQERKTKSLVADKKSIKEEKFTYNKVKRYLLPEGKPIAFLIELGIMNKDGKVFDKKQKKFRQINRFLEFVDDILDTLCKDTKPSKKNPLSIIDFGCGKSYLTFALYHFIVIEKKIPTKIIGLDLRNDVIQTCTKLAQKSGYADLSFYNDSIENYLDNEKSKKINTKVDTKVDMVISLHACNTASDYAIAAAIKKNAKVILSVPCCQHELSSKLQKTPLALDNPYSPFSSYGIIREQFSALTTDLMRALLLEKAGYKTQILEFIDIEHTAKNLLIRAVKKDTKENTKKSIEENIEIEALSILQKNLEIPLSLEKLLTN